jgi:serine O-acetyltransferase
MDGGPASLWRLSSRLHHSGHRHVARALKYVNYLAFRAILPPEAELLGRVDMGHFGLGVVVHPNTTLGDGVQIWHRVTIAVMSPPGSDARVRVGRQVEIGTGAVIISSGDRSIEIGDGTVIGAGAVVTRSLPPGVVAVGNPARVVHSTAEMVGRPRPWSAEEAAPGATAT